MEWPHRSAWRLSLAIVIPAALILAGAVAAVVISLNQMAGVVDRTEMELTARSAEAAVRATVRRMARTVGDYARWDDAVRSLYGTPDPVFVEENLSGSTADPVFFDTVYLIDADGSDVVGYRRGEKLTLTSTDAFGPTIVSMMRDLPHDGRTFLAKSGLVAGRWGLALVAVAPIVPSSENVSPAHRARYLAIGRAFDLRAVAALGEDYVIQKLSLGYPLPVADNKASLHDYDGKLVGWLTWSPRQLGKHAEGRAMPIALWMLGLVALVVAVLASIAVWGIHRLKKNETVARHAAGHDPLTGLPNRVALVTHLHSAISALEEKDRLALVYLDLDGFKEVNDSYGHTTGDRLLMRVAQTFQHTCGDRLLVRVGGDEFAVVVEEENATAAAAMLGARLVDLFEDRIDVDGRSVSLSTSVGVVGVTSGTIDADELMRRADVAMYRAKQLGRDRICVFEDALDAVRLRRMRISEHLALLLAAGELNIAYQPVFDARTGRVVSAEALLRWPQSGGEVVGPAEFVSIAEETGLIEELGLWTLRRACTDALAWPGIRLSVNVSPAQFRNPTFAADVEKVLKEVGFPANRLEVEVTENFVIAHPDQARTVIEAIRRLGSIVSLDDFGTGYSSIGYLRRFAFDKLKIDRTLVTRIDTNRQAQELIQGTVHIARALGLTVTAEGVETEAEAILLRAAGCQEFQGFYFARPEHADALSERLADERAMARSA